MSGKPGIVATLLAAFRKKGYGVTNILKHYTISTYKYVVFHWCIGDVRISNYLSNYPFISSQTRQGKDLQENLLLPFVPDIIPSDL